VIGEYHDETFPVFAKKAREEKARLVLDYDFDLVEYPPSYPYHKALNRNSVYRLAHTLKEYGWDISKTAIDHGYENMEKISGLKGRCQVISDEPLTIADVSHNADGLQHLFRYVLSILDEKGGELYLVFGTVKDKDLNPIFNLIPNNTYHYWTQSNVPRSMLVEELAIQGVMNGKEGECFKDVDEAITAATSKAQPNDLVLITGSTFVVAEITNL
ncbi:MAG: hypothetical protein AAFY41_12805, partial [Bacteroidota bacterium]